METRQILTPEQAERLAHYITGLPLPLTVTIHEGAIRTNPQNALLWKWNEEIAKARGDVTAPDVHRENKLLIGCHILMRDDPGFRDFVTKLSGLAYGDKLSAMDFISVTSRMTKKQMQEFMDSVSAKWSARGISLTIPEAA